MKNISDKKRFWYLNLLMITMVVSVIFVAMLLLYRNSLADNQHRLLETVQSQARLIEAIARYNHQVLEVYTGVGSHLDPFADTVAQVIDAHEHYKGFGETGEFTMAKAEGDSIDFLLSHRHNVITKYNRLSLDSKLAEPMRLALQGHSGTIIGMDYRGEMVVAGYEPIAGLGLGLVAKIDLAEIRAPFFRSGMIIILLVSGIVLIGSILFYRITNPIIMQLLENARNLNQELEERRKAEEKAMRSEERFRLLFNNVHDAVMVHEVGEYGSQCFIEVNETACSRLGYSRNELLRMTPIDIDDPDFMVDISSVMSQLKENNFVIFEMVHLAKDGRRIPVEILSQLFILNDRKMYLSVARDISERKKNEMLQEDVERIMKHDLKNPLSAIINLPELISERGNLTEDQRELLDIVQQAGERMLRLINQSLDIYKMETGRYGVNPQPVDVVCLLRLIILEFSALMEGKRVIFDILIHGKPVAQLDTFFVPGEELLFNSMLGNLIKNAIEASPVSGRIEINITENQGLAILSIHSQGIVPMEIRNVFFEKYSTSGKDGGTGLGNYTARLIAETHGGAVSYKSSEESGTTVFVRLPKGEFGETGGQWGKEEGVLQR